MQEMYGKTDLEKFVFFIKLKRRVLIIMRGA